MEEYVVWKQIWPYRNNVHQNVHVAMETIFVFVKHFAHLVARHLMEKDDMLVKPIKFKTYCYKISVNLETLHLTMIQRTNRKELQFLKILLAYI